MIRADGRRYAEEGLRICEEKALPGARSSCANNLAWIEYQSESVDAELRLVQSNLADRAVHEDKVAYGEAMLIA